MTRDERRSGSDAEPPEDGAPAEPEAPGSGVVGPDADDSDAPEPNEPA
jgi:hypothetical protein